MSYLVPLKIFVVGQLLLLFSFPFFPAIGTAADNLAADPASTTYAAYGWGWSWLMTQGVVKWLIYAVLEGGVWLATFMAFWQIKRKNG